MPPHDNSDVTVQPVSLETVCVNTDVGLTDGEQRNVFLTGINFVDNSVECVSTNTGTITGECHLSTAQSRNVIQL